MACRHVDLLHLFLSLVFIMTFWCVVYGQGNNDGPSNTNSEEPIVRRYWWTSMWGFIVTFIVLTMDVWGSTKAYQENTIKNVFATFFVSALNPLYYVWQVLEKTFYGMAMVPTLREALGDDIVAPMYPWSKSHIKIISGCDVIVNLSPDVHKENCYRLMAFNCSNDVEDLSEALVIGTKVANSKQFNVQLSKYGKLALLKLNVLPPYDELKFLRGTSSLGMAIASAQAIGYIYGIVVRCVQGLRVSPIEAIACVLNMVILIKGVLHNFSSLGHRPLLLYLLPEEEEKFIEECKNIGSSLKTSNKYYLVVSIVCGIVLAVGAYFIVNFLRSLNRISIVPIILSEMSVVLGGIQGFLWLSDFSPNANGYMILSTILLNLIGYIWALVVTFKYWKGEAFDVQSSNYISQVLPYIG